MTDKTELKLLTIREWQEKYPEEADDLSRHKSFTCVNHPGMLYSSKNPTCRTTFVFRTDDVILKEKFGVRWEEFTEDQRDGLRKFSEVQCVCGWDAMRYIDHHEDTNQHKTEDDNN